MTDIDKISRQYIKQSLIFISILVIIVTAMIEIWNFKELISPLAVSAIFSLVVECTDALIWKKVAKHSSEGLTTFYSAISGFRMLLALATMFIYYIIVGRDAMLMFFLVFRVFYFMMLAHHAIFYARKSRFK